MKTIFLFDLDSTITREEILPTIATKIGKQKAMRELTEKTMMGDLPFLESFYQRVQLLSDIPVSEVNQMVADISVNPAIAAFLKNERERCYIATNNLDVWISGLVEKLGMTGRCYCSKAQVRNDRLDGVPTVNNKEAALDELTMQAKLVAIGDGSNDYAMLDKADIGIAFGGVRSIAPTLHAVADYAVYDEHTLCRLMKSIIEEENEK